MAKFPGLFPIVVLLSMLGVSTIARAADEPVATAAIPPPLPVAPPAPAPAAPKAAKAPAATGATATPAKPPSGALSPVASAARKAAGAIASPAKPASPAGGDLSKRTLHPAALPRSEPAKSAVAQKPSRHAKRERHIVVARAYPPPAPARPRYYYPGAPVADPDNSGPPWPPPWYDRGRPLAGYPYPMPPRGPW